MRLPRSEFSGSLVRMRATTSKALQPLSKELFLPLLASSYEAGRLVPFIGAGMSRPKFAGWDGFVDHMEAQLEKEGRMVRSSEPETAGLCPTSNSHPEIRA